MKKRKTKKRKMKKSLKVILILILLVAVTAGSYLLFFREEEKKTEKKEVEVKEEKEKTTKASLVMVGDALLHSSVYKDAYNNGVYDFTKQIELIKPIVSKYDLAFYNQETVLGGTELGLSDYPTFNSPQEFGDAMLDAGFNIVNLASNHTIDRGEKAVLSSVAYWKTKDVLTAGSYESEEDYEKIVIKEVNGIKYTLLSYTYGTNGIAIPEGKDYLVNLYSDEKVKLDVEAVKDKTDVILVSMHWGQEYQSEPNDEQKRQAEYLASLGVNIIIGTHPHVVQPITYIGDTLVIYSLGNFISAQDNSGDYNCLVELMSSIDIVKTTKNGKSTIKLENLNNELLYDYYTRGSKWYNFKVIPFSQMSTEYNSDYKRLYEKYSAIVKMYDDTIPINAAA